MIDEKKLIEELKEKICNIPAIEKAYEMFYHNSGYNCAITTAELLIEKQPKVGEWIPFREREADAEEKEMYRCDMMLEGELPDDGQDILVSYADGSVYSDVFIRDGYECYLDSGSDLITTAIAWQPLPEPYKAGDT